MFLVNFWVFLLANFVLTLFFTYAIFNLNLIRRRKSFAVPYLGNYRRTRRRRIVTLTMVIFFTINKQGEPTNCGINVPIGPHRVLGISPYVRQLLLNTTVHNFLHILQSFESGDSKPAQSQCLYCTGEMKDS